MKNIEFHFSSSELAIIIFLLIFVSGSAGLIVGHAYAMSGNWAEIKKCEQKYKGMRCELVAQGVQG